MAVTDRTGNALGVFEIDISGSKQLVYAKTGDIYNYLRKKTELARKEDFNSILDLEFDFTKRMVGQGAEKEGLSPEQVEERVIGIEFNLGEYLKAVQIALKLKTEKDYDAEETAKN